MKNIHQVLHQKEKELERVRIEVEALRYVAPLLADAEPGPQSAKAASALPVQTNRWPLRIDEPPQPRGVS
jgi:hypothetical protein